MGGREGVDVDVRSRGRRAGRPGEVEVSPVEVVPGEEVVDARDVVPHLLVRSNGVDPRDEDDRTAKGFPFEELEERDDRRVALKLAAVDVGLDVGERALLASPGDEDRRRLFVPGRIGSDDDVPAFPFRHEGLLAASLAKSGARAVPDEMALEAKSRLTASPEIRILVRS